MPQTTSRAVDESQESYVDRLLREGCYHCKSGMVYLLRAGPKIGIHCQMCGRDHWVLTLKTPPLTDSDEPRDTEIVRKAYVKGTSKRKALPGVGWTSWGRYSPRTAYPSSHPRICRRCESQTTQPGSRQWYHRQGVLTREKVVRQVSEALCPECFHIEVGETEVDHG